MSKMLKVKLQGFPNVLLFLLPLFYKHFKLYFWKKMYFCVKPVFEKINFVFCCNLKINYCRDFNISSYLFFRHDAILYIFCRHLKFQTKINDFSYLFCCNSINIIRQELKLFAMTYIIICINYHIFMPKESNFQNI